MLRELIYLDNQATTRCDPRVVTAMLPFFTTEFGNSNSREHELGRRAEAAVELARCAVAQLIGAAAREIVFTSGATEANNLAVKGIARFCLPRGSRRRVITLATEHKCVLESVRDLAAEGFEPVVLPVLPDGQADLDALASALLTPALLVSVMGVNNETGVIQDLARISAMAHAAGARFHADLAQSAGKIAVTVDGAGLDLASLSAHKLYGPKGVGALYVRHRPRTRLAPLFSGGGQERGLRSGTVPTALVVGFGEACRIAADEMAAEGLRIASHRDRLWHLLAAAVPGLRLNGGIENRIGGNLNLTFPGVRAAGLMAACPGLCVSTGSACSSAEIAPSHVLTAMGIDAERAAGTLRLSVGRFNSAADIELAATLLIEAYWRLLPSPVGDPSEAGVPCPE